MGRITTKIEKALDSIIQFVVIVGLIISLLTILASISMVSADVWTIVQGETNSQTEGDNNE